MKLTTLLLTGFAALFAASSASAQTLINISGSTAFRAAAHDGILAALGGSGTVTYAYTGGTLGSADKAIFSGTVSGNAVIVRTNWSGSTEGIADLATQVAQPFLNDDTGVVARSTGGGTANIADDGSKTESDTVQFAFSDVDKALSNNPTATLDGAPAGVIAFRFVASKVTGGHSITNVTDQMVEALFSTGQLKASMLTGNIADDPVANPGTGYYVLPFGRNNGSGTRATGLAETRYGPFRTLSQYGVNPTITGSGSSIVMTNAGTLGNGGQSSGGTLRNFLSANTDSVTVGGSPFKVVALGWLGVSDANTAITQGGIECTYNGVLYSADKVKNGQYTFWGYLQLYSLPLSGLSAAHNAFNTAVRAQLANPAVLGSAGIALSDMKVTRGGGDGGLVSPN